jgi:hypothetical protein
MGRQSKRARNGLGFALLARVFNCLAASPEAALLVVFGAICNAILPNKVKPGYPLIAIESGRGAESGRGTGQIFAGRCILSSYYYVVSVCCVGVPVNLMRFPPVKAGGQGFTTAFPEELSRRYRKYLFAEGSSKSTNK